MDMSLKVGWCPTDIKYDYLPRPNTCGAVVSSVKFVIDGVPDGFVIQHVTMTAKITDCCDKPVDGETGANATTKPPKCQKFPIEYWEAFQVRKGDVILPRDPREPVCDVFATPPQRAGTKGIITIRGTSVFIKDYKIQSPPWKLQNQDVCVDLDREQWSSAKWPPGWFPVITHEHLLEVQYNCCEGRTSDAFPKVRTIPTLAKGS
jgi:hypothetical protein